jgi:hypothetical protein
LPVSSNDAAHRGLVDQRVDAPFKMAINAFDNVSSQNFGDGIGLAPLTQW